MYAYSFSEVKQNIKSVFEQAIIDGAVQIKGEEMTSDELKYCLENVKLTASSVVV